MKYQNLCLLSLAFLSTCASTATFSESRSESGCGSQDFSNAYYLIDVSDVAAASSFFQQLHNSYFEDLDIFDGDVGTRQRIETYYDTEAHHILNEKKELLHVVEENLPLYREERESIVYRENNVIPAVINTYEVKHYNKKINSIDKHSLFGSLKRKERPVLFAALKFIYSGDLEEIKESLKVEHNELVYLITHFGVSYGSLSLDRFHIKNYGLPNTYALLKFELLSEASASLIPEERRVLNNVFCQINSDFRVKFPHITPVSWVGYADYHKMATNLLPVRRLLQKYPILFQIGQIVILSAIGFLVLYLILGRYKKAEVFKVITSHHRIDDHAKK